MLSKSLIQLSVDGQGCVPSLLSENAQTSTILFISHTRKVMSKTQFCLQPKFYRREVLYSLQKQDRELTVAQIMNSL